MWTSTFRPLFHRTWQAVEHVQADGMNGCDPDVEGTTDVDTHFPSHFPPIPRSDVRGFVKGFGRNLEESRESGYPRFSVKSGHPLSSHPPCTHFSSPFPIPTYRSGDGQTIRGRQMGQKRNSGTEFGEFGNTHFLSHFLWSPTIRDRWREIRETRETHFGGECGGIRGSGGDSRRGFRGRGSGGHFLWLPIIHDRWRLRSKNGPRSAIPPMAYGSYISRAGDGHLRRSKRHRFHRLQAIGRRGNNRVTFQFSKTV